MAITILLFDAFMSVFAWTAVEALHLFRMIVVVYGIERDLKWLYMGIGWGKYCILFYARVNGQYEPTHLNSSPLFPVSTESFVQDSHSFPKQLGQDSPLPK